MDQLCFLLKSFAQDAVVAKRMLASFRKNNTEDIHLYAVVPAQDFDAFGSFRGADVTLIAEEEFGRHLTDRPVSGIRAGYINQEIIKLAFHELSVADSYFTVDSEAEFLRPFSRKDFLHPDGSPYSVLVEDLDLAVDPDYYRDHWRSRSEALRVIWDEVGVDDPVIRTCHGHQVMNSKVLASFTQEFLEPRGWSYRDALEVSPYEYTWYNAWLQKSRVIPIHPREPFVKVFHTEKDYLQSVLAGVGAEDLARGYLAVVINGSFAQYIDSPSAAASKPEVIARTLSYQEFAAVLREKMRRSAKRRKRNK